MATNENEIEIIVGDEAENKAMFESMSTESADKSDSGIQTSESNFDESKIMHEVEIHSTPVSVNQNKKAEDSSMLKDLYSLIHSMKESSEKQHNEVNNKFEKLTNDFDNRFDELRDEIHEQKIKCEHNFDELKEQNSELKNQINEINKSVEKTNEIFETNFNKLEQNIEKVVESVEEQIKTKVNQIVNTTVSNSGSNMTKISEEIINKVNNNDNSKNELISSSDKIVENEILKGDIMKIDSDDIEIVSESERVMAVSYTHLLRLFFCNYCFKLN